MVKIHPANDKGKIRIRFCLNKTKFALSNLGDFDDPIAYKFAQTVCDRISIDIAAGAFTATNNGELTLKYHPQAIQGILKGTLELKKKKTEMVEEETDHRLLLIQKLEERLETKYHSSDKAILNKLKSYTKSIETKEDAQRFLDQMNLSSSTIQRYLNTLQQYSDLFKGLKKNKSVQKPVVPFTKEEVGRICAWFEENTQYGDFVKFAFLTGFRPSEIIGLRWQDIDFIRNKIYVVSVLARNGENTSKRIRKNPKNNIQRTFPINNSLLKLLQKLHEKRDLNSELVFTSPEGKNIDDHNFSQRYWRKCLQELNIAHNDFYNCRRTFISHFLYETKDVVKCAKLTHNTKSGIQTIFKFYAGVVEETNIPELFV